MDTSILGDAPASALPTSLSLQTKDRRSTDSRISRALVKYDVTIQLSPAWAYLCRPREKANRPQTRRRKDTNEENLEKLRTIRLNQQKAVELAQLVLKREKKKQALVVSLACLALQGG